MSRPAGIPCRPIRVSSIIVVIAASDKHAHRDARHDIEINKKIKRRIVTNHRATHSIKIIHIVCLEGEN